MKNEKIRVTKNFTFDTGHALIGYDGPCKDIHGHTYHLSVTVLGEPLWEPGNPKDGMVVDFGLIKKEVQDRILAKYDHALVLNDSLPEELKNGIMAATGKVEFVPFQPSCENLLLHFKRILDPVFRDKGWNLVSLKLYETPTSFAEWLVSDQN